MADKEHVITEQMHDTRKDLADKLGKLEQKIAGAVETVSDTVSSVSETVESVKDKVEETISAVTHSVENTVESVTEGVGNTVESVKESVRSLFDVPGHVRQHPWLMLGGSVALGYLGGRLLLPRRAKEEQSATAPPSVPSAASYAETLRPNFSQPREEYRRHEPEPERSYTEERQPEAREPGFLGRLTEQFGGQLGHIKGLAVGTVFGAVRDMVSKWVPDALRKDVTEMINGVTTNLGGQVVQGPVFGESNQEDGHPNQGPSSRQAG